MALLKFFSRVRRHDMFDQIVDFCREWWSENNVEGRTKKKARTELEEEKVPNFLEFTQMMEV